MNKTNCLCPMCRRGLRLLIEYTLESERRWLGEIGLRVLGRLEWVPPAMLKIVLAEMCYLGILIELRDHPAEQREPISIYTLARLTIPADFRKRGPA